MKLLVVDLHHLGDAVMALPFIRAAQSGAEVHVCCRPGSVPVFERLLAKENIHTWSPPWHEESQRGLARAFLDVCAETERWRAGKFDAVSCVWADSRIHIMMAMSGIPQRIGFPMNERNYYAVNAPWRRRQLQRGKILSFFGSLCALRRLLTDPLHRQSIHQHHLASHGQIAAALGFNYQTQQPWFPIPPASPTRRLLIHTGGRLPTKRWPVEYFQKLLTGQLAALEHWEIILISGEGEPCPEPAAPNQRREHCASIKDLIELISRVDAVLCNDSLAGHIAAACGKKVLAIFGSGNPDWFSPGGVASNAIGPAPCQFHPCVDVCLQPRILCLQDVKPPEVEARLLQLLNA